MGIWDITIILLLVAAVVAIRSDAPLNTYRYAQFLQIRASIDHCNGGSLILPKITPDGEPAHKPQMYAWILTAAIKLTEAMGLDAYNDFVFRIPTILSAVGLAVLVYLFGRRWYNRRAGLIAACLWVTAIHMNKLMYLATTDMLLAWWIGLCIFCADRLTFHPGRRSRRWLWAVVLWTAMNAAAITKGWGIVNLALVGGFLVFAGCLGAGFKALRVVRGFDKVLLAVRLISRRVWAIIRATYLGWGLLAMVVVSVPLWWAMLHIGGQAFRDEMYFEVVQRITGEGTHAPHSQSGPAILHLYYNLLPCSIFAGCAFFLVPVRRWLGRRSPIALPAWWIITVLVAFSIPAGFRGDYLLPCYAAVALLAGWAVDQLAKPKWWNGKVSKHLRRICQAVPLVPAAAIIVVPVWVYFASLPPTASAATWYGLAILPVVGLAAAAIAVLAVHRERLGGTVAATCLCMLGVIFLYANLWSRSARTGDGDVMQQFAAEVRPVIGDDKYIVYNAESAGPDVYIGRFPDLAMKPEIGKRLEFLNGMRHKWLIVSDRGLLSLGAFEESPGGSIKVDAKGRKFLAHPRPGDLGRLTTRSVSPIKYEKWGTLYLIELRRPIPPTTSKPFDTDYISDPVR